jgi:hypothetical protein
MGPLLIRPRGNRGGKVQHSMCGTVQASPGRPDDDFIRRTSGSLRFSAKT